jgi:hypothetical protein
MFTSNPTKERDPSEVLGELTTLELEAELYTRSFADFFRADPAVSKLTLSARQN